MACFNFEEPRTNQYTRFLLISTPSLEDKEEVKEAIEAPDVSFEMAALAASAETGNGTQFPLGYEIEASTEGIHSGVVYDNVAAEEESEASEDSRALTKVG